MNNELDRTRACATNVPIFVVGAGRSGTTLLRLMLNEHPDIAIPPESHFIALLIKAFGPDCDPLR